MPTTNPSAETAAPPVGLRICHYGDPVLTRRSAPVPAVTPEIQTFAAAMVEAMYTYDGVGLAAPQVGHNLRLVVIDTRQSANQPPAAEFTPGEALLVSLMPVVLINPEIIGASTELDTAEEGCLSLPKIYGDVTRPARVAFRTQLLAGGTVQGECGGLLARCLQHEIDHLDGITFNQRMSEEKQALIGRQLKTLAKETRKRLALLP